MQMAGISLFLVVDILVWPNTTARLVTESLAKILSETLVSFSASVAAIRSLVEFFYRRNTIAFEPLVTEDSFPGHSDGSGDNINKGAAVRNRAPLTALTEMLEASEQIDESSISMPNIESDDTFVYRKPDFRMRTESAIMFDTELGMATEIQVEMTEDNDGMGHREIALALDLEECNACLQLASEGLKKAQKNTKTFKTLMLLVSPILFVLLNY